MLSLHNRWLSLHFSQKVTFYICSYTLTLILCVQTVVMLSNKLNTQETLWRGNSEENGGEYSHMLLN